MTTARSSTPRRSAGTRRLLGRARVSRSYKRWTPQDDQQLRELAGQFTSAELACYLGRSPRAVGQRLTKLGLSPHDADGRSTASELARRLGIPEGRVNQWCRLGLIPADKVGTGVGGMWRIEWDGGPPIGPASGRCTMCSRQLLDGRRRYCDQHRPR